MFPFQRFEAWGHCHRLTLAIYGVTLHWPSEERFGLTSQIRRAVVSVELNMAEGSAKRGPREFRRFLDISLGSLAEVACLLRLGADLGYLSDAQSAELEGLRNIASRTTWGLYRSLARPSA